MIGKPRVGELGRYGPWKYATQSDVIVNMVSFSFLSEYGRVTVLSIFRLYQVVRIDFYPGFSEQTSAYSALRILSGFTVSVRQNLKFSVERDMECLDYV